MTFEEFWVDAGWHIDFIDLKPVIQEVWEAAQKAERERIKQIIDAVGVQGNHDEWFNCCDTIMERIDSER